MLGVDVPRGTLNVKINILDSFNSLMKSIVFHYNKVKYKISKIKIWQIVFFALLFPGK